MLFNSNAFVLFFPAVVLVYFLTPHRWRWTLLLAASYYFYASWRVEYLSLILASTLIDFYAGLKMGQLTDKRARRPYLWLSLSVNLGLLFTFKYANFFGQSVQAVFDQFNIFYDVPYFDLLLPVGISFYTFQTLSYTVDVYNGRTPSETHLGIFALYVSFFPQLLAGPIERSNHLLPQFRKRHTFDYNRLTSGLKLMAWGFFKKLVVADRLAVIVTDAFATPGAYNGVQLLFGAYFFAFQVYCDFSGYSDIAIGSARILGYDLTDNFKRPYFSKSVAEFWRRWHITLSTWFRDYIYIPMGGNRVVRWRWYYNLVIVFLVSGLWHGAAWTFVIWGGLHGLYLIVGISTASIRERAWAALGKYVPIKRFRRYLAILITFHLITLALIFFRAGSMTDVITYFQGLLFQWDSLSLSGLVAPFDLLVALAAIAFMESIHLLERKGTMEAILAPKPALVRWGYYYVLLIGILLFGKFTDVEFVYFQF